MQFRRNVLIKIFLMSNSIVSKKRIMQLYYISILQTRNSIKKKTKTRSKKTNSVENIWSFRILIDLILWQILVTSEKFEFAFFASMYVRKNLFTLDALFFSSISWSFLISLTYLSKFLQSNHCDERTSNSTFDRTNIELTSLSYHIEC